MKPRRLADSEHLLLASAEGFAAFQLVLPLIRALALYIAGRGQAPKLTETLPDLTADAALERAQYRRERHVE